MRHRLTVLELAECLSIDGSALDSGLRENHLKYNQMVFSLYMEFIGANKTKEKLGYFRFHPTFTKWSIYFNSHG
jgi:hypothetical protein